MSESELDTLLPLLPLRDVVVYPHMVVPLFVGRDKSVKALEQAMSQDKQVLLVAQKDAATDEPKFKDLFEFGTVASVLQLLKLPDGTIKVLVEGINMMKKHVRPNPELGEKGGVVSMEAALDVSNVAVYNPVAKKGDRIGIKTLEDGKKVRYFKSNGEIVDI